MSKVFRLFLVVLVVFCGVAWAENGSLSFDPARDLTFLAACSNTCYSLQGELCEIEGAHITCRMSNCAYHRCECISGAYDCGV